MVATMSALDYPGIWWQAGNFFQHSDFFLNMFEDVFLPHFYPLKSYES